jgi:hypothetical protein
LRNWQNLNQQLVIIITMMVVGKKLNQRSMLISPLTKKKGKQLWNLLDQFQDVFAWNKRKFGCYNVGEHIIDTQGFPPCRTTPSRLSF